MLPADFEKKLGRFVLDQGLSPITQRAPKLLIKYIICNLNNFNMNSRWMKFAFRTILPRLLSKHLWGLNYTKRHNTQFKKKKKTRNYETNLGVKQKPKDKKENSKISKIKI